MKQTTSETLTRRQVAALRDQAGQHGDFLMVEIAQRCLDDQLSPDSMNTRIVLEALNDAEAQQ